MNHTITNSMKKRKKGETLTKCCKITKKIIAVITLALCITAMAGMTVFAASGSVNTTDFINKTVTVLQSVVSLIGAGLAIWGVVNLIEGYGGDNAAAKSQGMKQLMAGLGLVLLGLVVVPVLGTMMNNAMK